MELISKPKDCVFFLL